MDEEQWSGQTWTPFLTLFLADYKESGHLLASIPRLCFLLSNCEKSADYFTALLKNSVCIAWCQRCIWHGLGHGTKPTGMILKSHARRSMPKRHSLIYSSNWEHFNCQIIPREGALVGTGQIHAKKQSDCLLAQTNVCQCQKTLMACSE